MKKRICVFIGEIAQDYQKLVANSITARANSLGYDVVFICNYGSYNEDILYAEGEKSVINLPDCSTFDGIIVAEDVFDIDGMPDELYELLKKTAKCPVVYLRSTREDFYSVMIENKSSINSIVRHFIDDHGFTDICYMSGKKGAADASERLEGYMSAMAESGLEVTEHSIFHGDYWRYMGGQALDWFMVNRTSYPQAIVCANDYMALSICANLRQRGVRVPEDVCVSGFDLLDEAKYSYPSLTSLEVDFVGMVNRAVDIIDSVNDGNEEEHLQRIPAKLRRLKSCGCGKQHEYKDVFGLMSKTQRIIDDTKSIFISVTEYQQTFGFDDFMAVADKYRQYIRSDRAFICFTDSTETGYDEVENDNAYTNNMMLRRIFVKDYPAQDVTIRYERKDIIPQQYWSETTPNNFCVFPIHFKNVVYGYCVAEMTKDKWFDIHTQGYLMTLATAIQSSNLHQQIEQLESIRALYQNDPLTGIYNRRGFDKILKNKFEQAKNGGQPIAIASIDMDNLKPINDTYGHTEGDKAIVTLARAIESVIRDGECCARIGGDEFSALLLVTPNRSEEFKRDLRAALVTESKKSGVINEVKASIGICETTEEGVNSIYSCVQIADKRMYEDKKSRKASGEASTIRI